jgi:hypothetical protein
MFSVSNLLTLFVDPQQFTSYLLVKIRNENLTSLFAARPQLIQPIDCSMWTYTQNYGWFHISVGGPIKFLISYCSKAVRM